MKVLIVTADFQSEGVSPWLLDDLAREFAAAGHQVDVLVHSPTTARPRGPHLSAYPGVTIFSVGAAKPVGRGPAKFLSYLATAARLHTAGWRWANREQYGLCIFPTIASFSFGFPSRMRKHGSVSTLLFVLWDFFPIHQLEIGRIRASWLSGPLKQLERLAIRRADVIAAMTPANERFLHRYHPGLRSRVIQIPPWSTRDPGVTDRAPKRDRFTVIFGGQLAKGRGVDVLIEASALLRESGDQVDVLVAGTGPESEALRETASRRGAHDVSFVGQLDRADYRKLLSSCHVGIAVTVPGVTPPSFPSKIVEYCANGIPVIVSVEESSDAGTFVEDHGAGLAVPAGDPHRLADAIAQLAHEHRTGGLELRAKRATALFDDEFSTSLAARRMIDAAQDHQLRYERRTRTAY
jgi:glycosyltransferase involved in cell wall biosynthesis